MTCDTFWGTAWTTDDDWEDRARKRRRDAIVVVVRRGNKRSDAMFCFVLCFLSILWAAIRLLASVVSTMECEWYEMCSLWRELERSDEWTRASTMHLCCVGERRVQLSSMAKSDEADEHRHPAACESQSHS